MEAAQKPKVFYGYIIVLACFFIMVTYWGANNSYGIFFKSLIEEFGWNRAATSGAYSVMALMFGFTGMFTARLSDKYGPRIVIGSCGIIMGIGYILMSRITAIWQLYLVYDIFIAIGMGSYISLLPLVARWFTRRRALMTGVLCSGMGLGSIVFPPVAEKLITLFQWRFSFVILAVVIITVLLIATQFLKADPRRIGIRPYGESEAESQVKSLTGVILKHAVRKRQFWLLSALYFTFLFCHNMILVHIFIHALGLNVPSSSAASIVSVYGVAQIIGMNVTGLIADRYGGKRAAIIVFSLMTVALTWLLLMARDALTFYFFAGIMGFAAGGMQVLFATLVAEIFGLKSQGTILGTISFIASFGAASGVFLAGYIFDTNHSYTLAFIICTVLAALGVVYSSLIRPIRERKAAGQIQFR